MKIEYAKIRLYNRFPFLGTIVFNLPFEEVDEKSDVKTLATDGKKIYWSRPFWEKFDGDGSMNAQSKQIGLLAHEVFHLVLGHIYRKRDHNEIAADPKTGMVIPLWNIATDYADNLTIKDFMGEDYTSPEMLLDEKYRGWTSEKIYEDLLKKMKKMTKEEMQQFMKNAQAKCMHDDTRWEKMSEKEKKEVKENMDNLIKQGIYAQKQKGDLPAFLKRLWDEMQPKEDWRTTLREFAMRYQNDYTWSPTDRRYLEEDFSLPSIDDGEKIDWLAIAIDTSGSIGKQELDHFMSEIRGILSSFDKVKAKLTFCDAAATPFEDLEEVELSKIQPKGGGGTDFKPVFDLINKENNPPKALIYFTDMCGDFPRSAPRDYEVIWLSTMKDQRAPFGRVLDYDVNE